MIESIFNTSTIDVVQVCVATAGVFVAVITYTRIAGLRSFSKMSGFDFAMTVAVGSLMATVALVQVSFVEGLIALAVLYLFQVVIALLRRYSLLKRIIDNQPVLLLKDGVFLDENMKKARVTRSDILSKLREANVADLTKVHAVVFETTGDMSVLHGDNYNASVLLEGVENYK